MQSLFLITMTLALARLAEQPRTLTFVDGMNMLEGTVLVP